VEIKIFSTDIEVLKEKAREIAEAIKDIPGVVDVNDGLVLAGPSLRFRVREAAAARAGLTARDVGEAMQTLLLGTVSSYVLRGDRTYAIRVVAEHPETSRELKLLPLVGKGSGRAAVVDIAERSYVPGILEMHREDLRQLIAVSARLSGIDMGRGIRAIKEKLAKEVTIPPGASLEFGGLYREQQESFRNLLFVLVTAILLVCSVLLIEFRSILKPFAIVAGSVLALSGVIAALWITGTSLNIVSFLGGIIVVGIVAKNGILMLDYVGRLRERGLPLVEALVRSGPRKLRPVLMTSMTTFLGLLPLAYGVGAGADMLRPLAVAVIGALVISLILSLIAAPVFYYVLLRLLRPKELWGKEAGGLP